VIKDYVVNLAQRFVVLALHLRASDVIGSFVNISKTIIAGLELELDAT
jgi:hypothetical protein